MGNSQFRKPLIQSAAILCVVIVLFTLISSSNPGASILGFFTGIGNLILLLIGLAIALPLSIAILVAIFLGAVYLQSREKASEMYLDLKKSLPLVLQPFTNKLLCCNNESNTSISQEEYNQMEQEIKKLTENNATLEDKIRELNDGHIAVNKDFAKIIEKNDKEFSGVTERNSVLKEQMEELSQTMVKLQDSEKELNEIVTTLKSKFDEINDSELREQIVTLGLLHTKTNTNIDNIVQRLTSLEKNTEQVFTAGIFSYIKSETDQNAFIDAVKKAVSKDMTYSQIDEFLSNNISTRLHKIVKDHPSLTKDYIRDLKNN